MTDIVSLTDQPASTDSVLAHPRPVPVHVTIGARVTIAHSTEPPREVTGKVAILLALLGLEESVERRRAAALLWPDSSEEQARNNLRTLVHRLNVSVGSPVVGGSDRLGLTGARLDLVPGSADDVLSALAAKGPRECELLSDLDEATHGQEVSAWLQAARQRLRQRQLQQLREALAQAEADANAVRARALAQACVQIDPFSEHGHRQLMETLARFGDRASALAAYERLKSLLREHLGVSPDAQTRSVQLRILQDEAFERPSEPHVRHDTNAGPLPEPLSTSSSRPMANAQAPAPGGTDRYALVERDALLAHVQSALSARRHVSIEGEAGVGKTRLLRCLTDAAQGVRHVAWFSGDRHEPYAAVSRLLQAVQPRAAARVPASAQIELARLAPSAFPGVQLPEGPMSALRLQEALKHWLQALAVAGVQLLVLDDLHYADTASQSVLAALLEPSAEGHGSTPIWLMAHRSGEIEPVLEEAMLKSQVSHKTVRVTVPRLSLDGAQTLLRSIGADPLDAPHYWQRSGGNPLFLIELAQHVLESGESVTEAHAAGLNALLRLRLATCSEAARQLACVSAVASPEFTVELASQVLGQPVLSLMRPWNDLQQRGLFASHGLTHDLIREAVLSDMPPPIRRLLHARVGQCLEEQGVRGVQVLRHYMAADQIDRALPHAAHQLHAVSRAGLPTRQQEVELVELMNAVSDVVLLDNLWLTAEAGSDVFSAFPPQEVWPRLKDLLERVRKLPRSGDATAWIAYESARQLFHVRRTPKPAYDLLLPALKHLPDRGVARARVEYQLAWCAAEVFGKSAAGDHVRRALLALENLPDDTSLRRLRMMVNYLNNFKRTTPQVVRNFHAQLRAARSNDPAAAVHACLQIAKAHEFDSNAYRALRHRYRAARWQPGDTAGVLPVDDPHIGIGAFMTGRYDIAIQCFSTCQDDFKDHRAAFLAVVWWRLGDLDRTVHYLNEARPEQLQGRFLPYFLCTDLRAQVEEKQGMDPLPGLRLAHDRMAASGITGNNLAKVAWQIFRRERSAAERWSEGNALIEQLAHEGTQAWSLMIDAAEAASEAGLDKTIWLPILRTVARGLRRGHCEAARYNPEGLVRCARLLRSIDPAEVRSLLQIARRRVLEALPHVPPEAQGTFRAVPINALLLRDGDLTAHIQPPVCVDLHGQAQTEC
jgi:DNA-binding SARP family transcriptional activator